MEFLPLTIAIIPIIAAVATVLFADRPIFGKIQNPAKTAKNAALLAVFSALLLGNLQHLGFLEIWFWIPHFSPWTIFFFYMILAVLAVGGVLGLVVVLLARRRKPKRRILQYLAIIYSTIIVLTSLIFAVLGFVW